MSFAGGLVFIGIAGLALAVCFRALAAPRSTERATLPPQYETQAPPTYQLQELYRNQQPIGYRSQPPVGYPRNQMVISWHKLHRNIFDNLCCSC